MSAARQVAAVAGILVMTAIMGATIVGARRAFAALVAAPACRDSCRARGRELVELYFGGSHSANHGCVCAGGLRLPKPWIDLGTLIGVLLAIVEASAVVRWLLRRLRRRRA